MGGGLDGFDGFDKTKGALAALAAAVHDLDAKLLAKKDRFEALRVVAADTVARIDELSVKLNKMAGGDGAGNG